MAVPIVICTGIVIILAIVGWVLVTNEITYLQRQQLINDCCDPNAKKEKFEAFQAVSYDQHHLAIMFFRNPLKLYRKQYKQNLQKGS